MKKKTILYFFIISLMITTPTMNVRATTYQLGVTAEDAQTYNIVVSTGMYVSAYGSAGTSFIMTIASITANPDNWTVTIIPVIDGVPQTGITVDILDDPSLITVPGYICPKPVSTYLGAFVGTHAGWELSVNKITMTSGSQTQEMTYDTNSGWMTNMKVTDGGTTLFEMNAAAIPGYDSFLVISIIAVSSLGLIYVLLKKKIIVK